MNFYILVLVQFLAQKRKNQNCVAIITKKTKVPHMPFLQPKGKLHLHCFTLVHT